MHETAKSCPSCGALKNSLSPKNKRDFSIVIPFIYFGFWIIIINLGLWVPVSVIINIIEPEYLEIAIENWSPIISLISFAIGIALAAIGNLPGTKNAAEAIKKSIIGK